MNTLLLSPSDILFFRDGRPMSGSLSGHGSSWPLPTVTSAAIHAALHRADISEAHSHRQGRSGCYSQVRDRKFGSLLTAGPFPVLDNQWLFPRPLDAGNPSKFEATFSPLDTDLEASSLPKPLKYPVANTKLPSKATPDPWWNQEGWNAYLGSLSANKNSKAASFEDKHFAKTESSIGIGIDPELQAQDGERFFSSHSLRLKQDCHLGLIANAIDKGATPSEEPKDLIQHLFPNSGTETPIIAGGQQRVCTVRRNTPEVLPLPLGIQSDLLPKEGEALIKWTLLTPAIFPEIEEGTSKRGTERKAHPGGWLPTWICPSSGRVLLQTISRDERKRRRRLNSEGQGYSSTPDIAATLVSALNGKALPVTGYALESGIKDRKSGPKPTHLAVPAGSVYYFTCETPEDAAKLINALNWHGRSPGTEIRNRRSTLFGEKGFGLGACSFWSFHNGTRPTQPNE